MRLFWIGIWFSFCVFGINSSLDAGLCALCRRSLEQGGNAGLIHGFYWSILLIGGLPLLLILTAVFIVLKAEKRRRLTRP